MPDLSDSQLVYNNSIDSTKKNQLSDRILIPYFSLYSDRIVVHPRPFEAITKRKVDKNSLNNLKKKKFTGKLSKTQQALIKKKLTAWLSSIQEYNKNPRLTFKRKEHYPVFITLTLSAKQEHSDKEIKRVLLDQFIKKLKSKFGVNKYFWRAERQNNGNIHFHLIVDKYCNYEHLKINWNIVQNKLGYIDRFEKKHNSRMPNSVDVRSASSVKNFINYVLKYSLKIEDGEPIQGRIFGMSDELRNLSVFQNVVDSQIGEYMQKYVDHGMLKSYKGDFYTVLFFDESFYKSKFHEMLKQSSVNYYTQLYEYLYNGGQMKHKPIKKFKEKLIKKDTQLSLFKLSDQVKIINHYNYIGKKGKIK